jgi:glycosyltransferase involved in cell wall biosynthesis
MINSRICVITGPLPEEIRGADIIHVNSLLKLLLQLFPKIYLISLNFPKNELNSDKIDLISFNSSSGSNNMIIRVVLFIIMQIKISYQLIKIRNKIDITFFSIGAVELLLPILTCKLMNKKILLMHPGKDVISTFVNSAYHAKTFGNFYIKSALALEKLSYYLSDQIIVHSYNLKKYAIDKEISKKIVYGSRFYVDVGVFRIRNEINTRRFSIAYIGKFTDIKGIMKYINAMPFVWAADEDVNFLICGDGPQKEIITKTLNKFHFKEQVKIKGWMDHKKLPDCLNQIKILVIPSETEVGPQILLEAMACGTIVLSTRVGIVEHIIKDGVNGFILKDNSPECIAQNITRIIRNPQLNDIAINARKLVKEEYSLRAVSNIYKKIISD